MRNRRWQDEVEYDRYMRDRAGNGWPAAEAAPVHPLAARLSAAARDSGSLAAGYFRLGLLVLRDAASGTLLCLPGRRCCEHSVAAGRG